MTREEKIALLIDELEDIRCDNFDVDTDEDKTLKEAVKVIKALEQESCDKCIYSTKDGYCQYDDITEAIPPFKPCEDAISRRAVRHILNHEVKMPIKVWKKVFELVDNLPPVTPQYTDVEIQKMQELEQAEIQMAYELGKEEQPKADILDKIITEIKETRKRRNVGVMECLDIIERYKAESEDKG